MLPAGGRRLRSHRRLHRPRSAAATSWERFRLDGNGFIRFAGFFNSTEKQTKKTGRGIYLYYSSSHQIMEVITQLLEVG
jgi:hypothetical protein